MSRDSSAENLESILASIRRSLAEQATSVLDDEAAAPVELLPPVDEGTDLDAPPVPASLSSHLAITPAARQASPAATAVDVPQATIASPPRDAPAPAASAAGRIDPAPAEPAAAAPAGGQKDPLWFLGHEPEHKPEPKGATAAPKAIPDRAGPPPPPPQPSALETKPVLEAKPSPLGAVRGPLPPFFGSPAAEVVKVAFVPDPPARRSEAIPPAAPSPPSPSHPFEQTVNGQEVQGGPDAPPQAADSAGSMRASSIFGPPPGDARAGGASDVATPQILALEAMVAELLRPMLRRWLDENMPRLVTAALQAEAELMSRRDPGRGHGRDPKKP